MYACVLEGKALSESRQDRWTAFANEIAARRRELSKRYGRRITQKEIAQKAGITEKQLSRIETAVSGTEYETVEKLADALEYTAEERTAFFAFAQMIYRAAVPNAAPMLVREAPDRAAEIEKRIEENLEELTCLFGELKELRGKSKPNS